MGVEKSLGEINISELTRNRTYFPSPSAWEDEILYFLLVDRFSDGREFNGFADNNGNPVPQNGRTTGLFQPADSQNIDRQQWFANGRTWCGGHLKGLTEKLGYLKRLGITVVWISPVFKQTTGSNTYHGYGIQNFLDVDPHFGTREELKDFVTEAHQLGIRVILDIILNHAGDVFAYKNGQAYYYYHGHTWEVAGFKHGEADQQGSLPFQPIDLTTHPSGWPNGAIWPAEFQSPANWSCKGQIKDGEWDQFPEYLEGDFYTLKDISHGAYIETVEEWDILQRIKAFQTNQTLRHLGEVYKFWIAWADIDGYRIDTVKHMEPGAVRYFTNVIHEFAQSIGKENFYLIGEITGGRQKAVDLVDYTGLDAGLGIDDIQDKLEFLAKGYRTPWYPDTSGDIGYFNLFNNSLVDGKSTHQWFAKRIVTMFDDHDQVGTFHKFRFCGQQGAYRSLPLALALNLLTLGIPCIYYGTEQAFNGADDRFGEDRPSYSDTFLRECMFGGGFGSFQSAGKHFFNEGHPLFRLVSQLCTLRKQHLALRRGRQYIREVSASGNTADFYYPVLEGNELRWVVAWSRIFDTTEILCAINTNLHQPLTVWVTIDIDFSPVGRAMKCLYSTDSTVLGDIRNIEEKGSRAAVQLTVPAGGFVLYSN